MEWSVTSLKLHFLEHVQEEELVHMKSLIKNGYTVVANSLYIQAKVGCTIFVFIKLRCYKIKLLL